MTRSTRLQAAAVVLVLAVAGFTFLVLAHDGLAILDDTWRDWVIAHRTGFLSDVMVAASWFGSAPSLAVVVLATSAWLLHARSESITTSDTTSTAEGVGGAEPAERSDATQRARWRRGRGQRSDAVFFALSAVGGMLVGPVLKGLFDRARPALSDHVVVVHSPSYPSGHSLNSMIVVGLLTVFAARMGRRVLVVAVGAVLVGLVGFSRVYLGVHYPSDVLAGWLIGATWITLCYAIAPLVRGNSRTSGTVQGSS